MVRYDPFITHIVADQDVDLPALLKFIGLERKSQLDPHILMLSYEWVLQSLNVSPE